MSRVTETLFRCPNCKRYFRGSECFACAGRATPNEGEEIIKDSECPRCGKPLSGYFHKCRRETEA